MSHAAAEVGRRIRLRREELGLSQGALARRLGKTQTAVSYWEAGKRTPAVEDLLDLAETLSTTVAALVPQYPNRRDVAVVLRAFADQIDRQDLGNALEEFANAASASPQLASKLVIPNTVGAREAAEAVLSLAGAIEPPIDVLMLASDLGVRVIEWDFSEAVDGLIIQLPDGPAIGLRYDQFPQRKRFTVAHELGHYVLRHHATFHVDYADVGGTAGDSPTYNWRHEREANDFAANLLMPADAVRRRHNKGSSVSSLSSVFDVSKQAMGFRLAALGLGQRPH
jgi:Zn-dependent peptidase ImmA (M78 family)/transcriptional regulator with XRE-family HTH domain